MQIPIYVFCLLAGFFHLLCLITDYHEITASADGAYQRRGSGRCHNSLSGVYLLKLYNDDV